MVDRKKGTKSRNYQAHQVQTDQGRPPQASTPQGGGGGHNNAAVALAAQDVALNPPFDARMRRVGSPNNLASKIKRGWIQNETGTERVNFLFNPAAIDISSSVNPDRTQSPLQKSDMDVMSVDYTGTGSSTGVSLLYDRTYELFSRPQGVAVGPVNSAYTFGAYADIAAWYKFTKMLDVIPTSWSGVVFNQPLNLVPSYLFIGPNLYFYGYVTSLTTTITHWTQNMIPQRAKVDLGYTILPRPAGSPGIIKADGSTDTGINPSAALSGWAATLFGTGTSDPASDPNMFDQFNQILDDAVNPQ